MPRPFALASLRLFLFACVLWLALALARAADVPALSGRINDLAQLLDTQTRARLESKLAEYEGKSGHQFALLTLETLDGDALEPFSIRVVEAWKLGKKGQDDGLLLLVVKNDRKIRIEVGYGLEGTLTDALTARVTRNILAPAFRRGSYAEGIERAFDALMTAADGGAGPAEPAEGAPSKPARHSVGGVLGVLMMLFSGALLLVPIVIFLGVLFVLSRISGALSPRGRRNWYGRGSGLGGFGGFGGGGFGGFGGRGGGGFSGGGGSFGGGGSSGSW